MRLLLDSFWRAAAYCLHPRVILLTLLPLVIVAALSAALGYFYWEAALTAVRRLLESWSLLSAGLDWLDSMGAGDLRNMLTPLIVVLLAVPVIVITSLLLVALMTTPAVVRLVVRRRFPQLEARRGAGFWGSVLWSLGYTVLALLLLVVSLPLWLVPPLVLVLPPLIWGWLNYRVMSYDVLAEHADTDERRRILREHRWPLLGIGVLAGYLGAVPSVVWAVSATFLILAPVLVVVAVWLYTLVFAFSSLWFAHYALDALQRLRRDTAAAAAQLGAPPESTLLPASPVPPPRPAALPPAPPEPPLTRSLSA